MTDCIKEIERILENIAEEYTPPSSEIKATIHQWVHALHSDSKLFADISYHQYDKYQQLNNITRLTVVVSIQTKVQETQINNKWQGNT